MDVEASSIYATAVMVLTSDPLSGPSDWLGDVLEPMCPSKVRVLLGRQPGCKPQGGAYTLPGGKCDEGECLAQCAVRELWEETGLIVQTQDLHAASLPGETPNNPFFMAGYITQLFYVRFEDCTFEGSSPNVARRTHPAGMQFGSNGLFWKPYGFDLLNPLSMLGRCGKPGDTLEDMEFFSIERIRAMVNLGNGATRLNVAWTLYPWDCMTGCKPIRYGAPRDPARNWARVHVFTMTAGCGKTAMSKHNAQLIDIDAIVGASEYGKQTRALRRIAFQTGDWAAVHVRYGECLKRWIAENTSIEDGPDQALWDKLLLVRPGDGFGPGVEVVKMGGAKICFDSLTEMVSKHLPYRPGDSNEFVARCAFEENIQSTDQVMCPSDIVAEVERAWLSMYSVFPLRHPERIDMLE